MSKGKLAMEVVSAERNAELLETVPHRNMEDMAIVYRIVLDSSSEGRSSILVTNKIYTRQPYHCKRYDCSQ
ncbi:DUF5688 family protein [Butyrivibrio sp. AE3009]|uniref:DUF5688 family protein n=1 Tax=Butyrivibrio sp. AE3009 TaxID=1280666 RepID=UPI00041EAA3B|nr:DUF5688 family protein [Butyrivibrio sp. AE3009]